jgi:hypothetical protein
METKNEIAKEIEDMLDNFYGTFDRGLLTEKILAWYEDTEKRVYEEILEHTGLFCGNCLKQLKKLKEQKLGEANGKIIQKD